MDRKRKFDVELSTSSHQQQQQPLGAKRNAELIRDLLIGEVLKNKLSHSNSPSASSSVSSCLTSEKSPPTHHHFDVDQPYPPYFPDPFPSSYQGVDEDYDEPFGKRYKYTFEDEFGKVVDLPTRHCKRLVSRAAPAVVGLLSYDTSGAAVSASSGTIVEKMDDDYHVLTSACLVRNPLNDDVVPLLKIDVHLNDGGVVCGQLCAYDSHYNLALVSFKMTTSAPQLRVLDLFAFHMHDTSERESFYALGRSYSSGQFMAAVGNLISKAPKFDCQELLVTTCQITKCGIGGPVLDKEGRWVGVSFFDTKETPFLPTACVVKCLEQFKKFGKTCIPSAGLHLRAVECMPEPEKILDRLDDAFGIMVCEVVDGSSAHEAGIRQGDIISMVGEVSVSYVAEFAGELLKAAKPDHKVVVDQVLVKRISTGTTFYTSLIMDKLTDDQYNRWPVPAVQLDFTPPDGFVLE